MADEQQALEEFTRKLQEAGGATDGMIKNLRDAENSLGNFAKKSVTDVAKGVQSFGGSVIKGSKNFDALLPVVDALGSAMAGLAGAIPLVGVGAAKFVEGATEASKFLIGELGKQVGTFQEVSKSGVIAAGGMTQFSKQAFGSRLTLQQFGRVVTDNSKALAAMSGSAYDGVSAFSEVTSVLTDDQGMFARRLGMSAEEINEMTAGFMKQQTRLGRTQGRGTEQLLGTTTTYIKELDLLSKITGENRQELQKQQEATLRETRFSAMVAGMKEEEGKKLLDFVSVIGSSSPRIAAGMKDLLTAGTATTEEGRQLMMLSGGRARDIAKQLQSGAIDQVTATKMLQDAVGPNIERFRGLSAILGDSNEMTAGFAENLAFATRELTSYAELVEQSNKQMAGSDKLIVDMTTAQKNIEDFAMNLNKVILDLMPATGEIVTVLTDGLKKVTDMVDTGFKIAKGEITVKEAVFNWLGVTGKAKGGPVKAGEPYIVGEEGPEMFMPKVAGDIIPNHLSMDPKKALAYADQRERQLQLLTKGTQLGDTGDKAIIKIEEKTRKNINDYIHGTQSYSGSLTAPIMGNTAGPKLSRAESGANITNYLKTFETETEKAKAQQIDKELEAELISDRPSKTTEDTALMAQQNSKLDELIRLMGKQVYVSEQTRSQLM